MATKVLVLVLCALVTAAAADDGAERMRAELVDGSGGVAPAPPPQSADMAAKEAEALAGLEPQIRDALKDIMAVLEHGSEQSKDGALERLIGFAVSTGEAGPEQARMFRSAVVAGGVLPALVRILEAASEPQRQFLAAAGLHALALDDPSTDLDNFHQLEICQAGAVAPLVKLLGAEEPQLQNAVTGALAALAENPTCQAMIAAEGAVAPLMSMAHFGSDMLKIGALSALDVLSINNADVRAQLAQEGAPQMLEGLSTMGSSLLRDPATELGAKLAEDAGAVPKLNADQHVKAARASRVKYDGIRERAFRRMGGWADAEVEEAHSRGY